MTDNPVYSILSDLISLHKIRFHFMHDTVHHHPIRLFFKIPFNTIQFQFINGIPFNPIQWDSIPFNSMSSHTI